MVYRGYRHTHKGLWSGTTRVDRCQKKHSPTHTHPDHQTSFINFLHLQRSTASSLFILRAWQSSRTTSLSRSSLVLDPQLHTPYISSPNHHLLFAAHAHTNAAYSAAIPMLSTPSLSLSSLLGSLSFSLTPYIHLTILIKRNSTEDQPVLIMQLSCLQCFDAVGWAAERASGL